MGKDDHKPSLLLVHGACHGAWCWEKVVPYLAARGFAVTALDLPGPERKSLKKLGWRYSLNDYAAEVVRVAETLDGPVVLVGHSMGGLSISAAAERAPHLFARLVYLTAALPRDGETLVSLLSGDKLSKTPVGTKSAYLRGLLTLRPEVFAAVYCADASAEDADWACHQLVAEPLGPAITKLTLTEAGFGSIPRSYIRCTEDQAITIDHQDQLIERQPCEKIATLKASHSPFLSMPKETADAIIAVI